MRTQLERQPTRFSGRSCHSWTWLLLGACALLPLLGCSGSSSSGIPASVPNFAGATFTSPAQIDNPFFPLVPGRVLTYLGEAPDGSEIIIVEVMQATRIVMGVPCRVVRDRVFEDGELIEDTHDWYAQDDAGNVWYMGEEVDNYNYDDDGNLIDITHEGGWEAGVDVAGAGTVGRPGHLMKASPAVGDFYSQEYYAGHAEDVGQVIALNVPVLLEDGSTAMCLQTRDSTPLEPGVAEYKFYAPGIGVVRERKLGEPDVVMLQGIFIKDSESVPDFSAATFTNPSQITHTYQPFMADTSSLYLTESEDETETTVVQLQSMTRMVMGVECAVVRDRVFMDDLLIEDTHDWYAQDDAGNLWYMGEEVDNYNYDEDGNLIDITNEGAWEAGLDVAGVGSIAEPGYLINASPTSGDSYFQEFYEDEAEDMATVVRTGVTLELQDGSTFTNCLQTLEWNPQEPGGLEHKFYAPGVGAVRGAKLGSDEADELRGTARTGPGAVAVFGAATFTNPSLIDHAFTPFPAGSQFNYEGETEDGLETIVLDVSTMTRMVMGVECAIVQDRAFLDGVIQEDTRDWYAQDDDGNLWYMGEDVDNYNYDELGNLIDVTHEGSWEAGLDVAGVGSTALPGHLVKASPVVGDSHHQEYYVDEAEDVVVTIALDASVELGNGMTFDNCLQTLEWNPLDPQSLEYKYYALGVGLVLEENLVSGERVEFDSFLP